MKPSKRKVLVTGASGTLGFNLVEVLLRGGNYQIFAPIRQKWDSLKPFATEVEFIPHDLEDEDATRILVERVSPDVIVHCAASGVRPPRSEWFEMIGFNVSGSIALFKAYCALPRSAHFVYVSTGLVYRIQGRPLREDDPVGTLHPYGAGKAAADSLLLAAAAEFNRTITVLRPFAFTGKHDGHERLFPALLRAAASRKPFMLTRGDQIRDFCAVEDVAHAIVDSIERSTVSPIEIFNIGSGRADSVRSLIERICRELKLEIDLRFGQMPLPPFEPAHLVADISKARKELNWAPKINLAYAVWQLSRELLPDLKVCEPKKNFKSA